MKLHLVLLFILVSFSGIAQRQTMSLDGEWKFQLDKDSSGYKSFTNGLPGAKMVNVPHTWNVEDGTERYHGMAWYEKNVDIPAAWKGRQVRLHFEAVYHDAVVYVNGREAGKHTGAGFTPFSFDVSELLKYGNVNKLVVSVSNKFSHYNFPYHVKFDWPNDGGIIRPVRFEVSGKPSIRYAHIIPEIDFSKKSATATVNIRTWENDVKKASFTFTFTEWKSKKVVLTKQMELTNQNGIFTTQFDFPEIKLWHFDDPNLYTLQVDVNVKSVKSDSYTTRFGFRKVEIKGHQFFLNKEAVRLPGIEYMPGSFPAYGMAEPVSVMNTAVELMKNLNCVITRFHWQQDPRILDMLDERGILVQEEIPWWQAPGNLTPELEKLARQHIDEMIERDFNRPCIFSWGVSNEVFYNTDKDIYRRLIAHAKLWNTGNLVTVVSNEIFDRLQNDESLLGDIPTWNDYVGTWHGKSREETPGKLKLINDSALRGRPLLITEHGLCEPRFVGADARRVVEMAYHYDQWAKNDYIMGCIYFSLNDYRTHVGESGYGRYKGRIHGLTDLWFGKKPSYAVYANLAAPVYFESVQQLAKGTSAEVAIHVKNDLPSYTLYNYKLSWKTANGSMRQKTLPMLKPGEKYKTVIDDISPEAKPIVQIVRPTGYVVGEY